MREPLSRARVLAAAVARADADGIDAVSMRSLAQELGVVPMAIYKHVAGKDALLDGMVDLVVGEIPPPERGRWRAVLRTRILAAREAMLRHPWAPQVLESRTTPTPVVLGYLDSSIGILLDGGLSPDLAHHVMHALGSRILGFSQELYPTPPGVAMPPEVAAQLAAAFPNVVAVATSRAHDPGSVVGPGCDDQFEFEFGVDLLLGGVERLHRARWTSERTAPPARR
ncbi:MAG TPA: TetR/AcrR family transcriptional regulator C-terminal domain-containing protein [Candidatus Nanopelagicales bacterium]|nr:TetR/AcrR family transcriptional regulator C-terminal domain-containing protein [Candidatus Nanopelagicales bacterium]